MSSVRPYPAYEDSGSEWLGAVPTGWAVKPIHAVATCNDDVLDDTTPRETLIEYIEISDVDPYAGITARAEMTFAQAPSRARRRVQDGDVIVSTVRTYLRAIAPITSARPSTVVSTGFAVMRPRAIGAGYLAHLFRAEFLISEIIARSVGVSYPAINASEIMHLKVPVPPPAEQSAIAAFLDRETGKIDALVAEQERLIALLAEKRQAVISQAVTKGLDASVPMKDSGVEWLGLVPAHWEIAQLKRVLRSSDYGISDALDAESGVAILRMGNVKNGGIDFTDLKFVDAVSDDLLLRPGDLLFNRTNSLELVGQVGLVSHLPETAVSFASYLVRLRAIERVQSAYLSYLLNEAGILALVRRMAFVAIGQCNLNPTRYAEIVIALPSHDEQSSIVSHISAATSQLDTLTTEAHRAIALLRERRAALISAAVTGKIDVRPLLPAESETMAA